MLTKLKVRKMLIFYFLIQFAFINKVYLQNVPYFKNDPRMQRTIISKERFQVIYKILNYIALNVLKAPYFKKKYIEKCLIEKLRI